MFDGQNVRTRPLASIRAVVVVTGLALWSTPGIAQSGPASLVPQGSPIPRELTPALPFTAPGLAAPAPSGPSAFPPGQTVRIDRAAVTGATVYPPAELAAITDGLTGPAVPLARIERAREALLARYRADGYLLTTVSVSIDAAGNLRLVAIEGYIADVKLDGDIGPAGTQVLRFLNRITEERPIRITTLERYLMLATDVPGVTVRSVLQPAAQDPAAITLVAQVSRKAIDGLFVADNRAFRQTGPEQLLAVLSANSFTQFGERTELSILHSFNNTQTFGQAATEFFVGSSGTRLRLYGGAGGTNPSGNLRALGYDGQTRVFGIQASYPLIRSRQQTLSLVATLDAIESDIRTNTGANGAAVRASFDSLRVPRAGADYVLQDTLFGDTRTGVSTVSVRLSQGLSGLGATSNGNLRAGRTGSKTDFFKFNAELTRTQTLFRPWAGATVSLFGLVAGQVSDSVLPPSEKFFLGGLRYNRGFYAGEVTGDNALTATAELQLNTSVPLSAFGQVLAVDSQFYLFTDWGETWENQPQDRNRVLHSYGGGVRAQFTRFVAAEAEIVSRRALFAPVGTTGQKSDGVYWRLITRF